MPIFHGAFLLAYVLLQAYPICMDAGTLELIEVNLEELWREDLKCEFKHKKTVCSEEVVGTASSCHESRLFLCQTAFDHQLGEIAMGNMCYVCWLLLRDCWELMPL